MKSFPPPPLTMILSTPPAAKVLVTVPILMFSELPLLEIRITSAAEVPVTLRMPPFNVASSSCRGSRPSTSGRNDNFPHPRAFAGSVNKATPGSIGIFFDDGGQECPPHHNLNALPGPLLHELGHIAGKKIEDSRKKMGESGNHSGQEQPVAAGGSLSPEANAALLRRLRKGDESAYHELVDRLIALTQPPQKGRSEEHT